MAISFNSSNLGGVDFNLQTINKFNGVDYTTEPTLVDESRAIDISNYIPKGNSLVKRNGTEMVATLVDIGDKKYIIHNIWEAPILTEVQKNSNSTYHYVFATEKDDNGYKNPVILGVSNLLDTDRQLIQEYNKLYDDSNPEKYINKNDLYSNGFYFEGRLFILCMGEYLFTHFIYSDDNKFSEEIKIDKIEIKKVKDFAYIPTVLTGLGDESKGAKVTQLEQFNLLSNRCYMELMRYTEEGEYRYEIRKYLPQIQDSLNPKAELVTDIYINGVLSGLKDNEQDPDPFSHYYAKGLGEFYYSQTSGSLYFNPKLRDDDDSERYKDLYIKIEIVFNESKKRSKLVENMRFGIPYGSYGYRDRLFLSGNPNYPNLDIHSCESNDINNPWKDYTYFGDNSYATIGSSDSAITGYGFLNNGYMAVFKESKLGQPNLYIRNFQMVQDSEGNLQERFPINISGVSIDIDIKTNVISYENDLLVNCPSGIYKIMAGESTATQTYNSVEMSYFIRDNLKNDISNSSYIIFDNKLFISRKDIYGNDRIYVADYNRYSFKDGKQIYEWFVLDGLKVDKFYIFNNELYFSNEKGLFKFNNSFEDIEFLETTTANVNGEEFNKEVFVDEENDKIILTSSHKIIQDIISQQNCDEKWEKFKEKTKIRINQNFLIKVPTDIPIIVNEETGEESNGIIYDDGTNDVTFVVKYSDLKDNLIVPTIINNLLTNIKDTDEPMDDYPNVIYNQQRYYIEKITFDTDRYILEGKRNNEEVGDWNEFANEYIILMLNCERQHFYFDISEIYYNDKLNKKIYKLSDCTLLDGDWYYKNENDEYILLGNQREIYFNEFSLKMYNFVIDFSSLNGYIRSVMFKFNNKIKTYWRSKFMSLGRIDYLKTLDRFTFVADSKRGGDTNVGFRTTNKQIVAPTSIYYQDFNFDNVDFSNFSFSTSDFAKTHTIKKKIKNFSFIQLLIESDNDVDSTITTISFRYKYTKNNKGVK